MRVYYDRDADVNLIKNKKVAVFGYGSQGHAHALNMRDSGVKDIVIALRPGSPSAKKAEGAQFKVLDPSAAAKWADVSMIVTPDEGQGALYRDHMHPNLRQGTAIAFAHGLNIHFSLIEPRADLDVFMVAPRGPGIPCARSMCGAAGCHAFSRSRRTRRATRRRSVSPTPRRSAAGAPA